jgi:hypothetical protein
MSPFRNREWRLETKDQEGGIETQQRGRTCPAG